MKETNTAASRRVVTLGTIAVHALKQRQKKGTQRRLGPVRGAIGISPSVGDAAPRIKFRPQRLAPDPEIGGDFGRLQIPRPATHTGQPDACGRRPDEGGAEPARTQ